MISITEKIIASIRPISNEILTDGECALCGGNRTEGQWFPLKKVISANFTDFNAMKNKVSENICSFCKDALSNNFLKSPKGKQCGLRLYSFLIEKNQFRTITLKEKIYYLFDYLFSPPFILAYSQTGQKHISFKAKESHDSKRFWVCTENMNIYFDRDLWRPVYEIVNELYQKGVSKAELSEMQIAPWKFEKYNLEFYWYSKLKKIKTYEPYQLIISLLQKEKKNEN